MLKTAITVWGSRISPVLDAAGTLLVVEIEGHRIKQKQYLSFDPGEPLDLTQNEMLAIAKDLAKVDGALHIGADLNLHGFACLLDGRAVAGEDRSRGARYNSALRFTSENPNLVVIVVSMDKPVSIIQEGVAVDAQCILKPVSWLMTMPPTMTEWLERSGF